MYRNPLIDNVFIQIISSLFTRHDGRMRGARLVTRADGQKVWRDNLIVVFLRATCIMTGMAAMLLAVLIGSYALVYLLLPWGKQILLALAAVIPVTAAILLFVYRMDYD